MHCYLVEYYDYKYTFLSYSGCEVSHYLKINGLSPFHDKHPTLRRKKAEEEVTLLPAGHSPGTSATHMHTSRFPI